MSPKKVLKIIKENYPDLEKLPKAKLRLVEEALLFATQVANHEELISDKEHNEFLEELGGKITPASSLKAYRLREDLTQQDLAKKTSIAQANISAMEKGVRPIGLKMARKLASILGCDYKKLI